MRNLLTRLLSAGKFDLAAGRNARTAAAAVMILVANGSAMAQDAFKPPPPVTYTEKYEVYGGLSYMNLQAGQTLPKLMNMGGGEAMGTWWVTPKLGPVVDVRFGAGTTAVFPELQAVQPKGPTRVLVTQTIGMVGAQYRGPRNQTAALQLHALVGVSHGSFDWDVASQYIPVSGLYSNRTKPVAALGGSIDLNRSDRFAIRLQPDLLLEHFGSDTREFFSISAGVVYRFGKRQ